MIRNENVLEVKAGKWMDKRRLLMILLAIIGASLFIWIQFFEVPNKVRIGEEKLQQNPTTHNFEEVLEFDHAYMGDAPNINELFNALPLNEYKGTIEMDSNVHSLIVHYESTVEEIEEQAKQAVIYNTTAAFTLIENLETVDMQFEDKSYIVTRNYVEKWFGTTLIDFEDPEVFKEKVQDQLNDDIDLWLKAYTEGE